MLHQGIGLQLSLIGKQPLVHLPSFSLFLRTPERLGSFAGLLVNRLERKVARDIFELSGRNVCLFNLWQRLTDVAGTEGSLVVGEFD